jgi:hypothetical protein
VAGLLEQGGFVEHEFFSLATETVTSRPTAFGDRCALIVLFGLDDAHRIQFHQSGMKYREGPRVVPLARRPPPGIRCDRPEQGLSGNTCGQAVLAQWAASPC